MAEDVTLAHSSRAYVLASQIDPERYEIHFATSPRSRFLINTPDINYHDIQTLDPEVFISRLKKGQPIYSVDELSCSTEADLALLRDVRPEVVIGDFRLSLGVSSVLTDTPYVALTNAHWSPYSTQAFPIPDLWFSRIISTKVTRFLFPLLEPVIFWYHARAFNKVRRAHDLLPVGNLKEVYTHSTWSLFTDIPIIAPTHKLTKNQRYIGPVIWSPEIATPEWWPLPSEENPLIYVTMGSSGDTSLLKNILEAVRGISCTTLVATAGRVQIEPEPGIYIADYLPGLEVISKASMVICSGGSATAYQALSLGVPILGVPSNADQFFTMESIERNRAGLLLRPAEASVKRLQESINILLSCDDFKVFAGQLAAEISRYNSCNLFPTFLDEITSSHQDESRSS
jgi:UDP:flavonoid glycosyltransferase YjiC (YdhE family)